MKKICRIFFSRYSISALLIVLQVTVTLVLLIEAAVARYYIAVSCVVFSIIAFLHLVNRNANPEYKIPWSFIILTLPPVGAVLYFLFYSRKLSPSEVKSLRASGEKMRRQGLADEDCRALMELDRSAGGKARAILNADILSEVYRGTQSRFFPTGEAYFAELIKDISSAESYIFLEYFIIDEGVLWTEIHNILKKKAEEGVDVRLLYDDVGCMQTLPSYYELALRKEGIKAYRFSRVSAKVSSIHNNRDHRKICIVDGKVAYTGGVNIADEYINEKERYGHWKDGGIRLSGDAVRGLLKLFISTYDLTSKTKSDCDSLLATVKSADKPDGGFYIPYGTGPAPIYKHYIGKNVFLDLINQAEKYIYFTTPYLIIDYDLTEALRSAAIRGVDVRIVTPGIADKKGIKIMTKSSYPYLIEAGVKIYEYTPGFIHEKTLISDDKYVVVGTINFDYRSLVHHFENAVWMYNTPTVGAAHENFMKILKLSDRVDFNLSRLSFNEWIIKIALRIFAPLL